jgi:imidazole glycerol-phosphate synthase subunit HisH
MRVAVLDHGMGNLRSVAKALEAAGADVVVTGKPEEIRRADGLCVPGQGIFGRCMESLETTGLADVVRDWIGDARPYFGICLGMQVLYESSEERGAQAGLGVLPGRVERLPSSVTVPHMGWNTVRGPGSAGPQNERGPGSAGPQNERGPGSQDERAEWFYFDHSYAVQPSDGATVRGWCEHGDRFAAWISTGSITAVQFHPEKSSSAGIALLREWLTN